MDEIQAFIVLKNATAELQAGRKEHETIKTALSIISDIIKEREAQKKA